ncbi:MAG: conjugal transfer protein TraF [Gemmatimonadota bacterium]
MKTTLRTLGVAAAVILTARVASAQLPEASAAGFSMAGNYTAVARGFDAVAFNPANLGLRDNPSFSLSLFALGGNTGLDPVKFNDIAEFGGKLIPTGTKESWLQLIGTGKERGGVDGGLSLIALNIKNLGFQVGVLATGEMNLNADAAEALLFGNAGRTGTAKSFNLAGSSANGSAFGTGAVSLGIPLSTGPNGEQFSIGVTGKYIAGIGSGRAADNGSTVTPDNIKVQFPTLYTDEDKVGDAGTGFGVDVGLSWANEATTFSATARNVMNTFKWKTESFVTRVGKVSFDGTNSSSSFEKAPYSSAPAALRAELEEQKFDPEVAVGFAHKAGSLLVSLDAGNRFGDKGFEIGPKMHVGGGFEFSGLPILTLRGGAAAVTDGFQAAGGVGIHLGPLEISAGVSTRSHNGGSSLGAMLNILSIH